jgi:parallel beta-helix repeat protein
MKGNMRRWIVRLIAVWLLGGILAGAQPAAAGGAARKIHVRPGPDAIQRAINRADPGDILLVHPGHYHESPVVTKPLTIRGVGSRRPVVDGTCDGVSTIDVDANRVVLRRLKVVGANEIQDAPFTGFEVKIVGVRNVEARKLMLLDTCGEADYGINVYGTGRVLLAGNRARDFSDAGLYIGSIDQGPVTVINNVTVSNNRGILVEESSGTVTVRDNLSRSNDLPGESPTTAGIALADADEIVVTDNVANGNGDYGIHLADHGGSGSDDNSLFRNVATGNGTANFQDDGTGNCGAGNSFPIDPCP